jgi:HSP20 family protein
MSVLTELIFNALSDNLQGSNTDSIRDVLRSLTSQSTKDTWTPNVDIVESPSLISVYVELAGVSPDNLEIDIFNNKITVSGTKSKNYEIPSLKSEIIYGKFSREITIPISVVNRQNVTAKHMNGVLYLNIDKIAETQHRFKVNIGLGPDAPLD